MMPSLRFVLLTMSSLAMASSTHAEDFNWILRSQTPAPGAEEFTRTTQPGNWPAEQTAFIVCDVWDKHHCLNAVHRLEEFAPRLNEVLTEARRRGAVIVHAPSDCMPAYEDHPARRRAMAIPAIEGEPESAADWCSRIPAEEQAVYPIDQSDGGEDDEPAEHAAWAAELEALGRNPAMPWKIQSPLISIDPDRDYISDRGDEVWRILKHKRIRHVVLTGVHTNMCVLGRPFGLRQMVRNGFDVVLMRDMTDCMYNPARWPYVDHFTGNDLIISHVERYVCPTVTSDQVLGGSPFRFHGDTRKAVDVMQVVTRKPDHAWLRAQWNVVRIPSTWDEATQGLMQSAEKVVWYRAALVLPRELLTPTSRLTVMVTPPAGGRIEAWLNGRALPVESVTGIALDGRLPVFISLSRDLPDTTDAALLVIRAESPKRESFLLHSESAPSLLTADKTIPLAGRWQIRIGDAPEWSNMPLPAKFGTPSDIVIEPGR